MVTNPGPNPRTLQRRRIEEQLACDLAAKELNYLGGVWGAAWSSVPAWWASLPEAAKDTYRARVTDVAIDTRVLDESGGYRR